MPPCALQAKDARVQDAFKVQRAASRAAKRAALRAERGPQAREISQHRPFGNKPPPGFVRVPTQSGLRLKVVMGGSAKKSASTPGAGVAGGAAASARFLRRSGGGRLVALHHETTLAVALGLTANRTELTAFLSAQGTHG